MILFDIINKKIIKFDKFDIQIKRDFKYENFDYLLRMNLIVIKMNIKIIKIILILKKNYQKMILSSLYDISNNFIYFIHKVNIFHYIKVHKFRPITDQLLAFIKENFKNNKILKLINLFDFKILEKIYLNSFIIIQKKLVVIYPF